MLVAPGDAAAFEMVEEMERYCLKWGEGNRPLARQKVAKARR